MDIRFPNIGFGEILVTYIIPILLFSFALKIMLEKIRIFSSNTVNWGISLIIAALTIYFIPGLFSILTGVSILAICLFKIEGGKKYLIGIAAIVVYFFFVSQFLSSLI